MSDTEKAIQAENLAKCYRIGMKEKMPDSIASAVFGFLTNPFRNFRKYRSLYRFDDLSPNDNSSPTDIIWALKGVSFEIHHGEIVGIIGRNGAGKSTLLKILSRIISPTYGRARIRGRMSSLLEVGTGFNPELTGRENVYLNGTVLGMTKKEVDRKFDEIVDFSGIEKFIDTPVKRYSSGMQVRLAFSVAAHLEPEILLVDEVLAVGDAAFQNKCLGKMRHCSKEGQTVLLVSHNMAAIQTLCSSVILLDQGRVCHRGPTSEVVSKYLEAIDEAGLVPIAERTDREGAGQFRFESLAILDDKGRPLDFAVMGEDVYFRVRFTIPEPKMNMPVPLEVGILIRNHLDSIVTTLASFFTDESPIGIENVRELTCFVPKLPLVAGQYRLELWCATSMENQDWLKNAATLRVEEGNYFRSSHTWRPRADWHGCIVIPQKWYDSKFWRSL